jgi:hypothetical protein
MKKKKIDIDQRKVVLFSKGINGKVRHLTQEEGEAIMRSLDRLKKEGKVISVERSERVTEHEYIDHQINENILIENYEECARLLKLKNETPHSDELTRVISHLE